MTENLSLVLWGVAPLALGALVCVPLARWPRVAGGVATLSVAAASLALWAVVLRVFAGQIEPVAVLLQVPVLGGRLALAVDPLAALFLAILATVALPSTLFSVDYMTHFSGNSLAKFYPVLLVFFISIVGVLVSSDLLCFLVFWELMTLTSFFLVTFERESAASQRAGLKYFVITHAATLCIVVALLVIWRQSGSFDFAAARGALGALLVARPVLGHVVILLLVLGFATKAGVLPMGDWLPDAHPVAPTGMSAVLSGVLVKLGIYGLVRLLCDLAPGSAAGVWGLVLALAGTASLFSGTLTALKQTDSKRLMAFHTIGQVGYICLGLGVGLYCLAGAPALAALALMGALFHALNHACFKACLFLGAGAVLFRTGQRDMNRLGGLGRTMPITAGSSTVAALSIAGVPPLNGFASKWLIIATCLIAGLDSPLFLVLGLVAMFISLATLASFLKVLGAVFLGQADRTRAEVPWTMTVPQVVLATLCVLLGLFPQVPLSYARQALFALPAVPATDGLQLGAVALGLRPDGVILAGWAPLALGGGIALLGLLAYAVQRSGGARVREVPVWTCGEEHPAETVRYPASSFYLPLKRALKNVYPALRVKVPRFPAWIRRVLDLDGWLYGPTAHGIERTAHTVSRSHVGIPQVYLLWITVGAVVVVGVVLALA